MVLPTIFWPFLDKRGFDDGSRSDFAVPALGGGAGGASAGAADLNPNISNGGRFCGGRLRRWREGCGAGAGTGEEEPSEEESPQEARSRVIGMSASRWNIFSIKKAKHKKLTP